jgi:hypothetical protein
MLEAQRRDTHLLCNEKVFRLEAFLQRLARAPLTSPTNNNAPCVFQLPASRYMYSNMQCALVA